MPLTTPDIVMLIVMLVSAALGLFRGLVREMASLAIWFCAFVLAAVFAPLVADSLPADLGGGVRSALGFAAVFVAVLVAGAFGQRLLAGLVNTTGLTGTDRTLGLVFGAARGAIVVIVGLIAMRPFSLERSWWQESSVAPMLLAFEHDVLALIDAVVVTFFNLTGGEAI